MCRAPILRTHVQYVLILLLYVCGKPVPKKKIVCTAATLHSLLYFARALVPSAMDGGNTECLLVLPEFEPRTFPVIHAVHNNTSVGLHSVDLHE